MSSPATLERLEPFCTDQDTRIPLDHPLLTQTIELESVRVVAGVHGNPEERSPGVPLVTSLRRERLDVEGRTATGGLANIRALLGGTRAVHHNMALCARDIGAFAGTYDAQRFTVVKRTMQKCKLGVDMHANNLAAQNMVYAGPWTHTPVVLGFAALAGIRNLVVSDAGLAGQIPHTLLVDVVAGSRRDDPVYWRKLLEIALEEGLSAPYGLAGFKLFTQDDMSYEQQQEAGIAGRRWGELEKLPAHVSEYLRVDRPVYSLYGVEDAPVLEVVAKLTPDDIHAHAVDEHALLHMPTLKNLARPEAA